MNHEDEYHDAMVSLLELIWGEGFMAPGGKGNIAKLLDGLDLRGKNLLDIGCGLGGPALVMAGDYGAHVTGIDLEAHLIEQASKRAVTQGLDNQTEFITVKAGPLNFNNQSFDVVLTSGALTQTADKSGLFAECYRVLRPGGTLTCYEWMKSPGEYSQAMLHFFEMEGLTYALETLPRFGELLAAAGFIDIRLEDASDWYRREARREYELLKGPMYTRMVELIGQKDGDHFVKDWRAMVAVCEAGELQQGYCRGTKTVS